MIDFTCSVCGNDLEVLVCTDGSGFNVTPCENCLKDEKNQGYREGEIDTERAQEDYYL